MVAMVVIFTICDLIVIETIVQSIATFINNISLYTFVTRAFKPITDFQCLLSFRFWQSRINV